MKSFVAIYYNNCCLPNYAVLDWVEVWLLVSLWNIIASGISRITLRYHSRGRGREVLKNVSAAEGRSRGCIIKMVNNIDSNFEKVDKPKGGGLAKWIRFFVI